MGSQVEMMGEETGGREWIQGRLEEGKSIDGSGHATLGRVAGLGPSAPHSPYMVISRLFSAPVFLGRACGSAGRRTAVALLA